MSAAALAEVGPEVWLASVYCLLLVGLAYVIDALARRAASAAEGGASFGFTYHEDHDAWQCPEDQWLWPQSFDPDHRVMRYRATPTICNACPVKETCTTSGSGREIQRAVDSWPASEAARFHRWIACGVVLMGLLWPAGLALGGPDRASLAVLGASAALALLLSLPLWSHLRRSPLHLPEGMAVASRTLDEVVAEREVVATAWQGRRTTYRSDSRSRKDVP